MPAPPYFECPSHFGSHAWCIRWMEDRFFPSPVFTFLAIIHRILFLGEQAGSRQCDCTDQFLESAEHGALDVSSLGNLGVLDCQCFSIALQFLLLAHVKLSKMVQFSLIQRWELIFGQSTAMAALRGLPSGLSAFAPALVLPYVDQKDKLLNHTLTRKSSFILPKINLRYLLMAGLSGTAVALLLFILSPGTLANGEYWRWTLPAFVIGSSSNQCAITAIKYVTCTLSSR